MKMQLPNLNPAASSDISGERHVVIVTCEFMYVRDYVFSEVKVIHLNKIMFM